MSIKAGKEYELLIEKIYRELGLNATIKQDDHILGEKTETLRQIDLTIKSNVEGVDMLIIVEAKDHKNKADVNTVGAFISVIKDVRASKGILICNSGFTKAAKTYAKKERIELYSAHSALNKRWELEFQIPVIRREYIFNFSYGSAIKMIEETTISQMSVHNNFSLNNGQDLKNALEILTYYTNNQELDYSGKKKTHQIRIPELKTLLNGKWLSVEQLDITYEFVSHSKFLNYYTPSDYRLLKDSINEALTITYLNYDGLVPLLQKDGWKKVDSGDEVFKDPKITYIDSTTFRYIDKMYIKFSHIK